MELFVERVFRVLCYDCKHTFRDFRIKLRSHIEPQFIPHLFLRQIVAVASVGGHCVIAVCHGNDPRRKRDVFAAFAVRVALAVIAFMMIPGADAQVGGAADAGQDLVSDDRMLFDRGKFFVRQPPFLGNDRIRNADLADIMQKCSKINISTSAFSSFFS
jgi:hypothetical protein